MAETTKLSPAWAWERYHPSDNAPWNLERVGHLHRRATFGANWNELQTSLKDGPDKTIDQLLKGGEEIIPGISVKTFPGHTAHMQAVIVESGGKTACYISDLIPTSAHLDITWVMAFDLFPLDTTTSRKRYYTRSIPEKWLTVFTHDDRVPWGYVERVEGKLGVRDAT